MTRGRVAAGTLTQNKMAASSMWIAGREYRDLLRSLCPSVDLTYMGDEDTSPLGLNAHVLSLLTDSIALNSTAELRTSEGARPRPLCRQRQQQHGCLPSDSRKENSE
jgi:magnesium-transporting ATPase (P-type)